MLAVVALVLGAVPAAAGELRRCSAGDTVATIHVVDGMPFISARRSLVHVVRLRRGGPQVGAPSTAHTYYELFTGNVKVAEFTYWDDGSILIVGNLAIDHEGATLAVFAPRTEAGGCLGGVVRARSKPVWHSAPLSV